MVTPAPSDVSHCTWSVCSSCAVGFVDRPKKSRWCSRSLCFCKSFNYDAWVGCALRVSLPASVTMAGGRERLREEYFKARKELSLLKWPNVRFQFYQAWRITETTDHTNGRVWLNVSEIGVNLNLNGIVCSPHCNMHLCGEVQQVNNRPPSWSLCCFIFCTVVIIVCC